MSLLTTAYTIGKTSTSAAEFGKKGLVVGAGVGAGSIFLGEAITDDEENYKNAAIKGFVAGSTESAFSSLQELYAFHNPNSVQALSSINSTTSASANISVMDKLTSKKGWDEIIKNSKEIDPVTKKATGLFPSIMQTAMGGAASPENILFDFARNGMIKNQDISEDLFELLMSGADTDNIAEGMFDIGKTYARQKVDGIKQTIDIAESQSENPWFQTKESVELGEDWINRSIEVSDEDVANFKKNNSDIDLPDEEIKSKIKKDKIKNSSDSVKLNPVKIDPLSSMTDRTVAYFERNRNILESTLFNDEEGNPVSFIKNLAQSTGSEIDSVDKLIEYTRNLESGALGTNKEIRRIGASGKDAGIKSNVLGFIYENQNGSPLWARQVQKDIDSGKTQLNKYVQYLDGSGETKTMEFGQFKSEGLQNKDGIKIKNIVNKLDDVGGKGKVGRALALAGDIAMGGVASAALFMGEHALRGGNKGAEKRAEKKGDKKMLMKGDSDKNTSSIDANRAVNPVY